MNMNPSTPVNSHPMSDGLDLRQETNTIGVIVCYFGQEDGTYVPGKPGFIFDAEIVAGGKTIEVQSDASWKTHYGGCWNESDHYVQSVVWCL